MYLHPITGGRFGENGADPGEIAGNSVNVKNYSNAASFKTAVVAAVKRDCVAWGGTESDFYEVSENTMVPAGYYKVALVWNPGKDYHRFRQVSDLNGAWAILPLGIHPSVETEEIYKETAMKKTLLFINRFLLSLLAVLFCTACSREPSSGRETLSPEPTARPTLGVFTEEDILREDKDNRIEWKDVAEIFIGTKQEDVIRRLGFPNEDVGSGFFIVEYQCVNGDYVLIWYRRQESEEWTGFVVDCIMISDEPFWPK